MIQTIIEKLMGKAGEGTRKYTWAMLALVLLFVFMMWAPGISEETRRATLKAIILLGGFLFGANVAEHIEKRKSVVANAMKGGG